VEFNPHKRAMCYKLLGLWRFKPAHWQLQTIQQGGRGEPERAELLTGNVCRGDVVGMMMCQQSAWLKSSPSGIAYLTRGIGPGFLDHSMEIVHASQYGYWELHDRQDGVPS